MTQATEADREAVAFEARLREMLGNIQMPVIVKEDSKGYHRLYQSPEELHFVTGDLLAETFGDGDGLIAEAVNALPRLLDEIQRLRHRTASTAALTAALFSEAAINAAYDATRLEDGTPQFAEAGFCLGHAIKIVEAALRAALSTPSEVSEPVADESGGEGERRWSCECGWNALYTAAEITAYGEPAECPRCFKQDPGETVLATPPNPTNGDAVREALEDVKRDLNLTLSVNAESAREEWAAGMKVAIGCVELRIATLAKHGGAEG